MKRVLTQTFGVAGAIIEREGKFLLVKEAHSGSDKGKWNHPAGWIDVGESPLRAVEREVLEETGFSFQPRGVLGIYSLVRNDIKDEEGVFPHAVKIIFIGDLSDEPVGELEEDVSSVFWFSPEKILEMDKDGLRDGDIKIMVKEYLSGKNFPLSVLVHTNSEDFWHHNN
ncbi:MAG: NUDIX domain-containing protein [Patescibacteria group bacterium]